MYGSQLNTLLRNCKVTSRHYIGSFPCDDILPAVKYPSTLIANTEPFDHRGTHWIEIYIDKPSHAYYFDSLGDPPNDCLRQYLSKFFIEITRYMHAYQPITSLNCGLYCAVFLYHMSNSNNPAKVYNNFLSTLEKYRNNNPDLYITLFAKKVFDI